MKIDTEVLCAFCEKEFEVDRNTCEGYCCTEAKEAYYEKYSIIEDDKLTFSTLKLRDKIFILNIDLNIPKIFAIQITEMKYFPANLCLKGRTESGGVNYTIPKETVNKNQYENLFLTIKDCNKKLEEVCTQRIIELSKVIGSINL